MCGERNIVESRFFKALRETKIAYSVSIVISYRCCCSEAFDLQLRLPNSVAFKLLYVLCSRFPGSSFVKVMICAMVGL